MEHPSNYKSLKVLESCKIGPLCESKLSQALTFFDILWFKFHPSERIFFFSLPHAQYYQNHTSFFFDTLIPKLKRSLSLTLDHFVPLVGKIVWPSDSQKPFILYSPGDGVSLVIAEIFDADFNHLSGNTAREASEFRPLVPSLVSSDSFASVMALQVTLFPNVGFSIGISAHHAVLDGKSSTMFMKAWAYLCRTAQESPSSLIEELDPFLDRTVIKDPNGLDIKYLNEWKLISEATGSHERSLKILSNTSPQCIDTMALATFELNRQDLEKLKKRVLSLWDEVDEVEPEIITTKPMNLSTFVLASAFAFTNIAKAITCGRSNSVTNISFGFSADFRSRLEPRVHSNFLGNCVFPCMLNTLTEDIIKEEGVVIMAKKIHSAVTRLEKVVLLDEADALFGKLKSMAAKGTRGIGIGGSTRFGVYKTDFGWGRPVKVQIATVDINGLVTMAEGRDGNGGVELGLLLYKHELDLFASSFRDGIEAL